MTTIHRSPYFARAAAALALLLVLLAGTRLIASAAGPPGLATLAQVTALEHKLAGDASVRAALGRSFDILRVDPVGYEPGHVVIDLAKFDRSVGLRVLADARTSTVLRTQKLEAADVLFGESDVTNAFAIVRGLPSIRALLGTHVGDFTAQAGSPYRVEGVPVRGYVQGDSCSTHRCIELQFRTPTGYVETKPVLVDLTAGARIEGPAGEVAGAANRVAPPARVRTMPTANSAFATTECRTPVFRGVTSNWNICWYVVDGYGLIVGPTTFRPASVANPLQVIGDARVDQIFVPYASGEPRFYDVNYGFPLLRLPPNVCPNGVLLDNETVCFQVVDRGVEWLYDGTGNGPLRGREGQEAVLWGALNATNYQYIERYTFQDDGVVRVEAGATGENLPGDEQESHSHNFIWRVVPSLGGKGNSVNHIMVSEPTNQLAAKDVKVQVARPQGITWNPQSFDQLEVYSPGLTNARGDTTSYRMIPMPFAGLAHHEESFTQNDLWAISGNPLDITATNLPNYAQERSLLVDTQVALWYTGSFHHQPRDEDGYYRNGRFYGTTEAMFAGFMYAPRNLFDASPFF